MTLGTVTFEETGETREIRQVCARCQANLEWDNKQLTAADCDIVSRYGVAHLGADYGMTACGINATGDSWWHRL